ncbi:MAG: aminotransferase class IV [Candidatus Omnitrophica bacterium]|nr:aminotransferase class IV [Candidatus Omnitrophota bacterium]
MSKPSLSPQLQLFVDGKKVLSERVHDISFSEGDIFAFESLRGYQSKVFRIDQHLERLLRSAKTIGLKLPKTLSELKKELLTAFAQSGKQEVFLRLGVDKQSSYILVLERKRPEWIYEQGIDIKTAVTRRNLTSSIPPEAKTSAFFNNVLAAMEKQDAYEVIFLDLNGYVTEATVWNFFMVKEDQILTPEVGILDGVTRQFVIECAQKERLPLVETNLTRHDVWNADEAFLTSTSGEITPIRSLDGREIGVEIPGQITKKLMNRFHSELKKELGIR